MATSRLERTSRPALAGPDDIASAVVLVDLSDCRELAVLESVLTEALSIPVVRIGSADLSSLGVRLDLDTGVLVTNSRQVLPSVVWLRHASEPTKLTGDVSSRTARFYADSWSSFLKQLNSIAAATIPGREPGHIEQLVDAARLGVLVPRTIVSTSIDDAADRLAATRLAVKVIGPHFVEADFGAKYARFAEIVVQEDLPPHGIEAGFPMVVQEYVEHAKEFRVYYLNGGICCFEVTKPSPASIWADPGNVTVTHVECPESVGDLVRTLVGTWGLTYGAFDVLLTCDGNPVFLEVNADGDWLWFEDKAGCIDVTFMAAAMVVELHLEATLAR